jgi:hypothetical protein
VVPVVDIGDGKVAVMVVGVIVTTGVVVNLDVLVKIDGLVAVDVLVKIDLVVVVEEERGDEQPTRLNITKNMIDIKHSLFLLIFILCLFLLIARWLS